MSDTEFVRHGSSPTKSGVVRLGFVGQLPCRKLPASREISPWKKSAASEQQRLAVTTTYSSLRDARASYTSHATETYRTFRPTVSECHSRDLR